MKIKDCTTNITHLDQLFHTTPETLKYHCHLKTLNMWSWITIIIVLVAAYLIFKVIKSVIKTFFIISFLFLLIGGIFAMFLIKDIGDFQDKFPTSEKLFVLVDQEKVYGATAVSDFEDMDPKGLILLPDYEELETLKDDYFIVFVISKEYLARLPDQIPIYQDSDPVTRQELIDALYSKAPSDLMLKASGADEDMREALLEGKSEEDIRAMLIMLAFSSTMQDEGVKSLVDGIKDETLVVYPEYLLFKVLKKTPSFLVNRLI